MVAARSFVPSEGILFAAEGTLIDSFDLLRRLGAVKYRSPILSEDVIREGICPNARAGNLLRELQRHDFPVAAVSNCRTTLTLFHMLKAAGLHERVDFVAGVDCRSQSPGNPIRAAVMGLGLSDEDCTLVVAEPYHVRYMDELWGVRVMEIDGPHQVVPGLFGPLLPRSLAA